MGDKITLKIAKREMHGKKVARLRREGITPAVVYGPDIEPISVQADTREVYKTVVAAGKHTPVHLTGLKRSIAMIKDVDYDPTKHGVIRHVSFHAVNANEPVIAEVPIRLTGEGESEAEKAGLIVLQSLDKVEVKALPMDLPESIDISILDMKEAGDRVTLADATLPKGVELVEHDTGRTEEGDDEEKPSMADLVVANVYEPSALAAQNESAAGDAEDVQDVESPQGDVDPSQPDADKDDEAHDAPKSEG